jgi:hypothetical protein
MLSRGCPEVVGLSSLRRSPRRPPNVSASMPGKQKKHTDRYNRRLAGLDTPNDRKVEVEDIELRSRMSSSQVFDREGERSELTA